MTWTNLSVVLAAKTDNFIDCLGPCWLIILVITFFSDILIINSIGQKYIRSYSVFFVIPIIALSCITMNIGSKRSLSTNRQTKKS